MNLFWQWLLLNSLIRGPADSRQRLLSLSGALRGCLGALLWLLSALFGASLVGGALVALSQRQWATALLECLVCLALFAMWRTVRHR